MKDKKRRIIIIAVLVIVAVLVGMFFYTKYRTFNYAELAIAYENNSMDNASYIRCLDGVLRYSRDGIALLSEDGKEEWNQPCQMNNPIVEMCGDSVVVGDKGGTSVLVFQKNGLKGEFKTTKTIEKIAVSSQGIVSAILKDEEEPLVMCYDATGNKLVNHAVSLTNMGYPIDVAISRDGNMLLVSYLHTAGNEVATKVVYYYFGKDYSEKDDKEVHEQEFKATIIPTTAFLKKDISLLVADNALIFYEGLKQPKEFKRIAIDTEIRGVAYNQDLVAITTKNNGTGGQALHIYNAKGKLLSSVELDKEYTDIKVKENQVFLYDGQACSIYLKNGVCKYKGNMEQNIMEIFPVGGFNKYMVINASGFYDVQLVE